MPTTKKDSIPKKAVKKTIKSKKVSKPKVSKKIVKETVVEPAVIETKFEETSLKETVVEPAVIETSFEETVVSAEKFLNDFDWENFEEGIETIEEKKLAELEKLIKENFVDTYNDSVIEGTIINLTDREAIIAVSYTHLTLPTKRIV